MMAGRTPKRVLQDDWPHHCNITVDRRISHQLGEVAGVGPRLTDDLCEACETRIYATGECRCS